MTIKVSIIEDDNRIRGSLEILINGGDGVRCISTHASAETALQEVPALHPDVVLMDINLPKMSGIECVRRLKAELPNLQILMLTMYEDHDLVFQSLTAGASGYLVKRTSPAEILKAIKEVHSGASPMSGKIARAVVEYFKSSSPQLPPSTNSRPESRRSWICWSRVTDIKRLPKPFLSGSRLCAPTLRTSTKSFMSLRERKQW